MRTIIVGAGFGGISVAEKIRGENHEVILLDKMNHHVFQPLLYQVASSVLSPGDIAIPIREIFKHRSNVRVLLGEVTDIDRNGKKIILASGETLNYDNLVLAPGSRHHYFQHPEWEETAPGLKTIRDALVIREKLITAFEHAELTEDPAETARLLTSVVVGGGPTGVEMAGAIAEIARKAMLKNFRKIDPRNARVILVEAGPRILPAFPPALSARATRYLQKMGVLVLTGTAVQTLKAKTIKLAATAETGINSEITFGNIIWAAGNVSSPLLRKLKVPLDRAGRVMVGPDLSLPGHPEIFVIGDAALLLQKEKPLPGIAPVAIQMGHYVGNILSKGLSPAERKPFHYRDLGILATVGKSKAVAFVLNMKFAGLGAWFFWLLVHVRSIVSFRDKIFVVAGWAWSFLTGKRPVRLITGAYQSAPVKIRPSKTADRKPAGKKPSGRRR